MAGDHHAMGRREVQRDLERGHCGSCCRFIGCEGEGHCGLAIHTDQEN